MLVELIQQLEEFLGQDGLDQVLVRPGLDGIQAIGQIAAAGGDEDLDVVEQIALLTQRAAHDKTIATRHQKIAQHDIRLLFERDADAVLPVVRGPDHPTLRPQLVRQQVARNQIIIDQQSGFHQVRAGGIIGTSVTDYKPVE